VGLEAIEKLLTVDDPILVLIKAAKGVSKLPDSFGTERISHFLYDIRAINEIKGG